MTLPVLASLQVIQNPRSYKSDVVIEAAADALGFYFQMTSHDLVRPYLHGLAERAGKAVDQSLQAEHGMTGWFERRPSKRFWADAIRAAQERHKAPMPDYFAH